MDIYYNAIGLPPSVKNGLDEVAKRLSSFKSSDFINKELFNPSVHLLRKRGKLVRPTLVLLGAYFLNEKPAKYVDLALSAEMIHISSLIHDDMIDRDDIRRGQPTVHRKYGSEAALIAGDALISKSISMASKYGNKVMEAMSAASLEMCAGELLDYNFQRTGKTPTIKECLNIDTLKSASLIAACCNVVAVHKEDRNSRNMYLFGRDLGIAFQIRDDIIDYIAWAKAGRKGIIVTNIVSSIEAEKNMSEKSAILEAQKLNKKYIKSASRRLGNANAAKMLRDYANLIMIRI
jgi:geranylgeranyl pyrophosphate synthase